MGEQALARAGEIIGAAVPGGGSHGAGAGRVPGVVAAVGRGGQTLATWVAGLADATPGAARPMTEGTVFDLASLTKVIATTTAVLALAGHGQLGIDDPVTRYLPGFAALREGPVTVRQLLAHTSGLPATRTFYRWCQTREELLRDLLATPLEVPPQTRVAYSDLGFMALGEVIAAVAGEPLDAAVRDLVTGPLGMTSTRYLPLASPAAAPGLFAATEPLAGGAPLVGVVHDENARLMGGIAGHAGLFGAVTDLGAFCAWWVSSAGGPVPAALRREAESCQTTGLGGRRGLGWTCTGDRFDILGGYWGPSAVSHTGFTGTSLAVDSTTGLWAVLLTNSVHFGRDATAVKALRRDFHAAVAAACLPLNDAR